MPSSPKLAEIGPEESDKLAPGSSPGLSREVSVTSPVPKTATLSEQVSNKVKPTLPNKDKSAIKVSKYGRDYLLSALGHANVAIGQIETYQEQVLPADKDPHNVTKNDQSPKTEPKCRQILVDKVTETDANGVSENFSSPSEPGNSKHIQRKREWNQDYNLSKNSPKRR